MACEYLFAFFVMQLLLKGASPESRILIDSKRTGFFFDKEMQL